MNNSVLDLAKPMVIASSVPLGMVDLRDGTPKPHTQSRGFMDRLRDFGSDVVVNSFGGAAMLAVAGVAVGAVATIAMSAAPILIVMSAVAGGLAGLVGGGALGVVRGAAGMFDENKRSMSIAERIHGIEDRLIDMFTQWKKPKP
jgi:hypothetical protein